MFLALFIFVLIYHIISKSMMNGGDEMMYHNLDDGMVFHFFTIDKMAEVSTNLLHLGFRCFLYKIPAGYMITIEEKEKHL